MCLQWLHPLPPPTSTPFKVQRERARERERRREGGRRDNEYMCTYSDLSVTMLLYFLCNKKGVG